MKCSKNKYALITGASKGLGKALALELASRKFNVLLVALSGEGLPELCSTIRKQFGVKADYLEIDLLDPFAVHKIVNWVGETDVHLLINNAGVGGTQYFEQAGYNYLDTIIQVNIRVLSLLTYMLLPALKRQDKSYILNVASMAAFSPIAYKTVYPASKSFVYSFSRCLNEELKHTQISVSVLHPGPMKTNAEVSKRIDSQGRLARLIIQSPETVARITIQKLLKEKEIIIPGFINQLNWLLMKLTPPGIRIPLISRMVKREINMEIN